MTSGIDGETSAALERLGVALVSWPSGESSRRELAASHVPRLLLVEPGAGLPTDVGVDEDWTRTPVDEADLLLRARRLRRIAATLRSGPPFVDEEDVLHHGGRSVRLSTTEAEMVRAMVAAPQRFVDRALLGRIAGANAAGSARRDALDAAVYRLRKRLMRVGLSVRAHRGRGYRLEVDEQRLAG